MSSSGSGGLDKNWDGAKLAQKVQANAEIATAFSQQAYSAVGSYIRKQQTELQQLEQAKTDAEKAVLLKGVKELKLQERAMNILIGAVTGAGASAVIQETLSRKRGALQPFLSLHLLQRQMHYLLQYGKRFQS